MPRRAAGGAWGGAEFGAGLARVGGLEDLAAGAGAIVARGSARRRLAGDRTEIEGRSPGATRYVLSNHVLKNQPSRQPRNKPNAAAQNRPGDAMPPPQRRAENGAEQQSRTAEQEDDFNQTDGIVEDADV